MNDFFIYKIELGWEYDMLGLFNLSLKGPFSFVLAFRRLVMTIARKSDLPFTGTQDHLLGLVSLTKCKQNIILIHINIFLKNK